MSADRYHYLLCSFVNIRIQPCFLILLLWGTWGLLFSWDERKHRLQGTFRFGRFGWGFRRTGNLNCCFSKARKRSLKIILWWNFFPTNNYLLKKHQSNYQKRHVDFLIWSCWSNRYQISVLLTETNRNTAKYNKPEVSLWNNYQTLDNSDYSTVIPEKIGNKIERDDSYNHFAFTRTEVEGVEPKQRMANLMSWKEIRIWRGWGS